jgi:hypothetical protein
MFNNEIAGLRSVCLDVHLDVAQVGLHQVANIADFLLDHIAGAVANIFREVDHTLVEFGELLAELRMLFVHEVAKVGDKFSLHAYRAVDGLEAVVDKFIAMLRERVNIGDHVGLIVHRIMRAV